jgi:hypothetical protein
MPDGRLDLNLWNSRGQRNGDEGEDCASGQ